MTDEALETLKANTSVITERLTENQTSSTRLSKFVPSELYVTKKYEIEEFTLRVPKDEKTVKPIYTTPFCYMSVCTTYLSMF